MNAKLINQVKSGIPGLDKLLHGGFRRESITVITGSVGSGKSTVGVQFLVNGITEHGEKGLLISFESPKYAVYSNMIPFGWDLANLERERKFVFIEYPASEMADFANQEGNLRNLIGMVGVERVVIDSIAPISYIYESEEQRRLGLMKLVEMLRKLHCTVLVVSGDTEDNLNAMPRTTCGIESFTDGMIHTYNLFTGGERVRGVSVLKMRGSKHDDGIYKMEITDEGVVVSDKKISFGKSKKT
ncbi:hypothetical protein AUJ13_00475 [Candidatus Micrarchaeota archaeon CG1_02_49_24]|nr:MAG: hypothetical protein AUJ13_00475 [Candidatus Micrarchaeota archaeon CG1_02_49_24]HII53528.1 hypothetical protein [Candidatus Micrarchaeota archaeon]